MILRRITKHVELIRGRARFRHRRRLRRLAGVELERRAGRAQTEIGYLAAMEGDAAYSIGKLEALISNMERQEEARAGRSNYEGREYGR